MTHYVVHYSSNNGVTYPPHRLRSTSTSDEITGLSNSHTYSISVEAMSGESETMTITLCELYTNEQ